ncbi:SixA phosphatase family protein [Pontibacter locisalis]|uniref:SixA phosphatase family protein n=1 Tax=Pontibacter locisalis TaxID=1719035 RepID=A0ABW5ISP3_9BACT
MQRRILICRHAETNEPHPFQSDFERELTIKGTKQARETGSWLREKFTKVDCILASPAKRAQATVRIIAGRLYFPEDEIKYDPDLYNAREQQLLQCLSTLPAEANTVLLVGHNPGITRLARELTDKLVAYLEPADVVAVEIELPEWNDIHYTTGTLSINKMQQA